MIGVMVHRRQVALRCERWRAVDVCAARGRRVNVWASFRQPFCQRSRCNHEAIVIGVMINRRQVACDVRGSGWSTRAVRSGAEPRRHCVGRLRAALSVSNHDAIMRQS